MSVLTSAFRKVKIIKSIRELRLGQSTKIFLPLSYKTTTTTATTSGFCIAGLSLQRLVQVRSGPPKIFQRRRTGDDNARFFYRPNVSPVIQPTTYNILLKQLMTLNNNNKFISYGANSTSKALRRHTIYWCCTLLIFQHNI